MFLTAFALLNFFFANFSCLFLNRIVLVRSFTLFNVSSILSFTLFFFLLFLHCNILKHIFPKDKENIKKIPIKDGNPFPVSNFFCSVIHNEKRINTEINIPYQNRDKHEKGFHWSDGNTSPYLRNNFNRNYSHYSGQSYSI